MLYNSAALRGGKSLLHSMRDTYNTACLYGGWDTAVESLDDNQKNMIFATIEETYAKPAERKFNGDRTLIDEYIVFLKSMVPLLYRYDNALATNNQEDFNLAKNTILRVVESNAREPRIQNLLLTSDKYRNDDGSLIGEPTFIYEETKKAILKKFNALRRLIMRGPRGTATYKNTTSARRMLKIMRRDMNVRQGSFMRGAMGNPNISYFGYAGRTTVPTAAWKSRYFPRNTILSKERYLARRAIAKAAAERRKLTPEEKERRKRARAARREEIRQNYAVGERRAAYSALVAQDKATARRDRLHGDYTDAADGLFNYSQMLGMEGIDRGAALRALNAEDDARQARQEAYARYLESEEAANQGDADGAAQAAMDAVDAAAEAVAAESVSQTPETIDLTDDAMESADAAIETAAAAATPATQPAVAQALAQVDELRNQRAKTHAAKAHAASGNAGKRNRTDQNAARAAALSYLPSNYSQLRNRLDRIDAVRKAINRARTEMNTAAVNYLENMLRK